MKLCNTRINPLAPRYSYSCSEIENSCLSTGAKMLKHNLTTHFFGFCFFNYVVSMRYILCCELTAMIKFKIINSLLPGFKIEWPIFNMALPVPGHERVKQQKLGEHIPCIYLQFGVLYASTVASLTAGPAGPMDDIWLREGAGTATPPLWR